MEDHFIILVSTGTSILPQADFLRRTKGPVAIARQAAGDFESDDTSSLLRQSLRRFWIRFRVVVAKGMDSDRQA